MKKSILLLFIVLLTGFIPAESQNFGKWRIIPDREEILYLTSSWNGERLPDGRPKVSDNLLERLKHVRVEDAWQYLHEKGYVNQFEGEWQMLKDGDDEPIVGRALTALYLPRRPDVQKKLVDDGLESGFKGVQITWPIEMLQKNDVYVADNFGKIEYGTLIGDNLGTAIFSRTGTGVVFDGAVRDSEILRRIDGFNAFARAFHPSYSNEVMLMGINVPVRIGKISVLPGDVILAKRVGLVVIPPQFVEEIVITSEIVQLRDEFSHQRVREGVYRSDQVDARWTVEMEEDFLEWIKDGQQDRLPVPIGEFQKYLEMRTW